MSNQSIKVNLSKISGALFLDLKGTNETKKCIVLPVDDCNLFVGDKGVYLNIVAIEYKEQKYAESHFLKQDIPKEVYEAMTKEQQDSVPICGGVKPIIRKQMESSNEVSMEVVAGEGEGNGLPF